jgi:glycosyltransferase involved in cell wall biosynthesis
MAAGLPVIAAPAGGIRQLFDDGIEGRFWALDDPEAAATILIEAMENERNRLRMARAARRRFLERFASSVVCPQLYRFLTSVEPRSPVSCLAPADRDAPLHAKAGLGHGVPTDILT